MGFTSCWAPRIAIAAALVGNATPIAYGQCEDRWMPGSPLASFDGQPHAMTLWDPDGPGPQAEWLVVGGGFSIARNISALNIAAWDGTRWHAFGPGLSVEEKPSVDTGVRALTVFEGQLVAAGDITGSADQPLSHIARWDGASWQPLAEGLDGHVYTLTIFQGELIAGGNFIRAGETTANGIARWDGTRWEALGAGIGDGAVFSLAIFDDELIAAGYFNTAGEAPANSIARWNGSTWRPLGTGLGDGAERSVSAMTVFDGALVVGGRFSSAGGRAARNLAEWNGQEWRALYSEMTWSVEALNVIDGELVVSGSFSDGLVRSQIFRLEGGAWVRVGPAANSAARDLIQFRDRIVACGGLGDPLPRYLAQWDGRDWRGFGARLDLDMSLNALVEYDGELIGGIGYMRPDSSHRPVVRWDGHWWSLFGFGLQVPATGGGVNALSVYRDTLFAGGVFSLDGDQRNLGLVELEGWDWQPVDGAPSGVSALCVYRDELIVSGFGIRRWDGADWHTLGAALNGATLALTVYRDELIAGGRFGSTSDGQILNRIAAWNGEQWRPLGAGMNYDVWALTVSNDRLIAGGEFVRAGDADVTGIAQWDGAAWSSVGPALGNGPVNELTTFRGDLVAAGYFTVAGGIPARGIARWDGNAWHAFDEGIPEYSVGFGNAALAEYDGALFVSGQFTRVGGDISAYWARWMPFLRGDLNIDGYVNNADLFGLLNHYGMSQDATARDGDTDADGDVDLSDLAELLANFGTSCP